MGLPLSPFFFFLFLAFFYLGNGENESVLSKGNCPKGFSCGSMGPLEFPFAQHTHCGLVSVNCDAKPLPAVQLEKGGHSYQLQYVIPFWGGYTIIIGDSKLQRLIDDSRNYSNLNYTLQFPNYPSVNFRNIDAKQSNTIMKCNDSQVEVIGDYERYNCSDDWFSLNYKNPWVTEHPKCDHAKCTLLPSPIFVKQTNFSPLTAQFGVYLSILPACNECYHGGGQCTANINNEFQCAQVNMVLSSEYANTGNVSTGKNKLKLILITVHSGFLALILVSVAIFLVWRRNKGSNGYARNASLDQERGRSRLFGILFFSYSELEETTNSFDPSKQLGDGDFGTVYYGMLRDRREVAVKRLHERNFKRMEQLSNEISILTRLHHQNLVTLYGCSTRNNHELLLVYEYIPNGTIADHLHGKRAADRQLTWPIRMKIAVETAAALVYLHASDIIHRDVKTSNILLDENFYVKVADFGLSRLFPANMTHASTTPQGTPGYVDPDYHECYQLTYKSDVYSFGVVLAELVSSMPAVDVRRHSHEINLARLATNKILTGAFDELIDSSLGYEMDSEIKRMTVSVAEIAFQCLQPDKDMRPTMEQVLESLKDIQGYNELNNEDGRVNGEELVL